MPRVAVPDGEGQPNRRVWGLRPELGAAAQAMREAAYHNSVLPHRLQEAVRYRIAIINGCQACQAQTDYAEWGRPFYDAIPLYPVSDLFSKQEKMALLYAERYASDPHSIDDQFFEGLHEYFSDAEIVDLSFIILRHLSFGRFTHSLGLDDHCEIIRR